MNKNDSTRSGFSSKKCNIDIDKLLKNPHSFMKTNKASKTNNLRQKTIRNKTSMSNERNKISIHSDVSKCNMSKVDSTKVSVVTTLDLIEATTSLDYSEGDSDDDNDDTFKHYDVSHPSPNTINFDKMQRFSSLLQSEDYSIRVDVLRKLLHTVDNLVNQLPTLPPLDFPPPYEIQNIALTYNRNSAVSDMASGIHVPQWAQWQNTHSSLGGQFNTDSKSKQKKIEINSVEYKESDSHNHNNRCRLQKILDFCGKILYRTLSDSYEKCRQLATICIIRLCLASLDMSKQIGFMIPAIICRYPPSFYDKDMMIFVYDMEEHERFKRGGAVERQDRRNLLNKATQSSLFCYKKGLAEKSEEVRLLLCQLLSSLIRRLYHGRGSSDTNGTLLHLLTPYFTDIILLLQTHLQDPCPFIKIEASHVLIQVVRIPEWEKGAKYFAEAIARATIPNLRHSHWKVRVAAISLFEACVSIPDREKVKGAGTSAIIDLIGFREENVIPVASFYESKCGVSVNCLAELVMDRNSTVRARCCSMLAYFMTCLPNRYDYHQRLLPYLLSFFHDSNETNQHMAWESIEKCGQQYEAEHPDDVIERRQYGVDGDNTRCNYTAKLPCPFERRPRLGARLFVRENTKRFFKALLREVSCSSWNVKTKHQSTNLLTILVVYCEEQLTMGFSETLPLLAKGLMTARFLEYDVVLQNKFQISFELLGRFVDPETYVPLFLPRIKGDVDSTTTFSEGSSHSERSRAAYACAFQFMLSGSLSKQLFLHRESIVVTLTSDECIGPFVGSISKLESIKALTVFLERIMINCRKQEQEVVKSDVLSGVEKKLISVISSIVEKGEEDEDILVMTKKCRAIFQNKE